MIRLLAVVLSVCVDALVWDLRVQKKNIVWAKNSNNSKYTDIYSLGGVAKPSDFDNL